jgi:hypothetical protein
MRCPLAHKTLSVAYADIVTRYMYHRDASTRAELTIIAQDLLKHTDETSVWSRVVHCWLKAAVAQVIMFSLAAQADSMSTKPR